MDRIIDLQEKYAKVRKLTEEESKKDPETEPYRSKYKARDLLSEMKEILLEQIDSMDMNDPNNAKLEPMLALVLLQLGTISLDTEELSLGEEYLTKCVETIKDHLNPNAILISLNARNQLGILWSQRSDPDKAKVWLEGCEKLYEDYMKKGPGEHQKNLHEIFEAEQEISDISGEKEIEKVHTHTKFYLAQVYGTLKDFFRSAIYCHETLRRQLEHKEYDPIDWALNSATLSQFFMERTLFKQARHHLAAAAYILDEYEENLKHLEGSEEEIESKKEEFRHRSADVSRCWAKYGICILEYSKNRLSDEQPDTSELDNEDLKKLWFESLELAVYENQVTDTHVLMFDDAREVFLFTQKQLNKAKEHYNLEDHASDYVQVVQDHSQLFKHLSSFELDEERQCKMYRKRLDLLEAVIKELNPQYYMNVCRQLWFEMGECYHDLMQLKHEKAKELEEKKKELPTPHALKKINFLAESSIMNFNHFLESVKEKTTQKLPETLPEDLVRPILVANFYLGRLYYKIITPDTRQKIENTTKAYESFKYLVDYCENHEGAKSLVGEELGISKEMMTLLHVKILQY